MQHKLKILPEFFDAVETGVKPFEVRFNDRGYKVGDTLMLREGENDDKGVWRATGRKTKQVVTYVYDGELCKDGYVVLGLKGAGV